VNIDEIFSAYTAKVADVEHYRRTTEDAADRELAGLLKLKAHVEASDPEWPNIAQHNFSFKDAANGEYVHYAFHELTADQAIQRLLRHTNRQHQWFLAELYELFEEFLKKAYACMGHHRPDLWPLRDFGGVLWGDVSSKSFPWFLDQVRQKKEFPQSVLKHFRNVLPSLRQVEARNTHLYVAALLVGSMRHRIVHARGLVQDRAQFLEDVLKAGGASQSGELRGFLESRLLLDDEKTIYLLKVPADNGPPLLKLSYDTFRRLADNLLAYAHQITLALGAQGAPSAALADGGGNPPLVERSPV
jgi:hypothetical protein